MKLRRRYSHAKIGLKEKIERVHAKRSPLLRQMVAEGRGRELPSETALKSDPLSVKLTALWNELQRLEGIERRRRIKVSL